MSQPSASWGPRELAVHDGPGAEGETAVRKKLFEEVGVVAMGRPERVGRVAGLQNADEHGGLVLG
jgi:hypothetical protein